MQEYLMVGYDDDGGTDKGTACLAVSVRVVRGREIINTLHGEEATGMYRKLCGYEEKD